MEVLFLDDFISISKLFVFSMYYGGDVTVQFITLKLLCTIDRCIAKKILKS